MKLTNYNQPGVDSIIANHKHEDIEAQLYGFDKTMAPAGKGTIKVELTSSYAYWRQLYNDDREKYKLEKQKVAGQVIESPGKSLPRTEGPG